jgi:hypothetical protein
MVMQWIWRSCVVVLGIISLGCSSTSSRGNIFAPYRGSAVGEELRSPPPDDARYTSAPSYPPSLLKPVAKMKDEENGTGLRRAPIGGGMSSMPGPGGF